MNDINSKKAKFQEEEKKVKEGGDSSDNEKAIKAYVDKEKESWNKRICRWNNKRLCRIYNFKLTSIKLWC